MNLSTARPAFCLIVVLLCTFHFVLVDSSKVFCQEKKEDEKQEQKTDSWMVLPLVYYTPETNVAFGTAAAYYFRPRGTDLTQRPSVLRVSVIYTLKKQWELSFLSDLYTRNEGYRVQGLLTVSRWLDRFYGIGSLSNADDREDYTSKITNYYLRFQKKIHSNLFLAIQHEYQRTTILDTESEGMLEEGQILGSESFKVSGFTMLANWDSRDNLFNPSRGSFHEISASVYRRTTGSDYHFNRYNMNLRTYIPVHSSQVLAFQSFLNFTDGDVPFQMMSFLGGPLFMRGYYKGRYRNKHAVIFQVDYRLRVNRRWGVVGFAALGDVAERFRNFRLMKLKTTLGAGIRFSINPDEKIDLRFDVGFSRESVGIYFTAVEAF